MEAAKVLDGEGEGGGCGVGGLVGGVELVGVKVNIGKD